MVGIPETDIGGISLEDLSVGGFYNEDELIIHRSGGMLTNMTTLRRIPESDEEITINRYFVKSELGEVVSITYDGGQEFFPGDLGYEELNRQLQEKGR